MNHANHSLILDGITSLSNTLNQDQSPVDWYETLKKYDEKINRYIQNGIIPPRFSAPIGVQVELTYECNLKCIHCYNASATKRSWRDGSELKEEEWLSIADQLVASNIFECIISGGEPLLRKNMMLKFMDKLSKAGVHFILISNGWLMKEGVIKELKKYMFQYIQISLDGATPHVHDDIRGVKGSWERAIEAALRIKKHNLPLCVATTLMEKNFHQLEEFIDLAADIGANQIIIDKYISTGMAADNEGQLMLPDGWRKKYNEVIAKKRMQYIGQLQVMTSLDPAIQLRQQILSPNKVALVRPNGNVKLDCITPFVFGNLRKDSLYDIWSKSLCEGWQKKEVLSFIDSLKSNEDLTNSGASPIPHATEDITLEHYLRG